MQEVSLPIETSEPLHGSGTVSLGCDLGLPSAPGPSSVRPGFLKINRAQGSLAVVTRRFSPPSANGSNARLRKCIQLDHAILPAVHRLAIRRNRRIGLGTARKFPELPRIWSVMSAAVRIKCYDQATPASHARRGTELTGRNRRTWCDAWFLWIRHAH